MVDLCFWFYLSNCKIRKPTYYGGLSFRTAAKVGAEHGTRELLLKIA